MSNRFFISSPFYNCEKYIKQFLLSIISQSYENWHLVLIDDLSTDSSIDIVEDIITKLKVEEKVSIIKNDKKLYEVENVLNSLDLAHDNDIICRIDPDDYLCELDAFKIINEVYKKYDCDTLWTAHRWFDDENVTNINISKHMPDNIDPYKFEWVSSHLKTFRKYLLDDVDNMNFRGIDNQYIKRAGDQAIYLPALYNSKKRLYLNLVTYAYRCSLKQETFQTQDAKFQASEAQYLRQRGYIK